MAAYAIEPMQASDWAQVRTIYLDGIATGQATLETEAPSWERSDASHLSIGRLVARTGEIILGWAALSPVSSRPVYRGVAEVSLYVGVSHRGQGVGTALLAALIAASEQHGIWTLQAGIFPENEASVALFKKCGFREVGRRERLGQLQAIWRDVLLLERRSVVAGSEQSAEPLPDNPLERGVRPLYDTRYSTDRAKIGTAEKVRMDSPMSYAMKRPQKDDWRCTRPAATKASCQTDPYCHRRSILCP